MTDFLEHPLVRKYFYGPHDRCANVATRCCMAKNVLDAMQQPIRDGELYLNLHGDMKEPHKAEGGDLQGTHWHLLRLPDRFQPPKDPVEEQIASIINNRGCQNSELRTHLEWLVNLARKDR